MNDTQRYLKGELILNPEILSFYHISTVPSWTNVGGVECIWNDRFTVYSGERVILTYKGFKFIYWYYKKWNISCFETMGKVKFEDLTLNIEKTAEKICKRLKDHFTPNKIRAIRTKQLNTPTLIEA